MLLKCRSKRMTCTKCTCYLIFILFSSPILLVQNVIGGIFSSSTHRVYRLEIAILFLRTLTHVGIFDPALWSVLSLVAPLPPSLVHHLRVHTVWRLPISGIHGKISPGWWGVLAHPLSAYYHHVQSLSVRSSWVGRYTHPISSLLIYVLCVRDHILHELNTNKNLGGQGASDRKTPAAKTLLYRSICSDDHILHCLL